MTEAEVKQILAAAQPLIAAAANAEELEALEVRFLGRKGELTAVLRGLKDLPENERGAVGQTANVARRELEAAIADARFRFTSHVEAIDTTLPGIPPSVGHLHILTEGIRDITRIFEEIGFTRVGHPEIETDWFTFGALNMPPDEPARNEAETFFMDAPTVNGPHGLERFLLTTQATSGTARVLATKKLPMRVINIQKTYRRENDASHSPMFHQFDGLYVDEGVTIQHLKGVFEYFVKAFFGPDRKIRFRPHHFRFTEPSFEIDITCALCGGAGCKLCKEGWLELGGSGMVHPNVFAAAGLDPKKVTGFAFGWGVERNVLMRAGVGIPDIRILYENDVRFLEQF